MVTYSTRLHHLNDKYLYENKINIDNGFTEFTEINSLSEIKQIIKQANDNKNILLKKTIN